MSLRNPKIFRTCLENPQPLIPRLKILKTLIFNSFLSSLLMVISSSLVNVKRLKDGNFELCRLFVVINKLFSFK